MRKILFIVMVGITIVTHAQLHPFQVEYFNCIKINDIECAREMALKMSKDASPLQQVYGNEYLSDYCYEVGAYNKSQYYAEHALEIIGIQSDIDKEYRDIAYQLYLTLFKVEISQGNFQKAKQYVDKATRLKQPGEWWENDHYTSQLLYYMQEYETSLNKSYLFINQIKRRRKAFSKQDSLSLSSTYTFMAESYLKIYEEQEQNSLQDSIRKYYQWGYKSSPLYNKNHPQTEYDLHYNLFKMNISFKQFALAGIYYKYLQKQSTYTNRNPFRLANYMQSSCKYFLGIQELDSCIYYGEQYLQKCTTTPHTRFEVYNSLATAYKLKKTYDKSNTYAMLALEEMKQLENESKERIGAVHTSELSQVKKESGELLNLEKKRNTWYAIIGGVLIMLLLVLIGIIWRVQKKQMNKYNMIMKEYQNKEKSIQTEDKNVSKETFKTFKEALKKMEMQKEFVNPNFTLAYVSKKLNSNTSYVSYYFNHIKKQSFSDYLNNQRINYIIEEYKTNPTFKKYSIEGLAKAAGYSNAATFSRVFKRIMSVPPSIFFEQIQ